jgi:hypothetical protein
VVKSQSRYCSIVDADKWSWQILACAADIDDWQFRCEKDVRHAPIVDSRQDSIAAPVLQP